MKKFFLNANMLDAITRWMNTSNACQQPQITKFQLAPCQKPINDQVKNKTKNENKEKTSNLRKITHKTLYKITRDLDNLSFNKVIASLYEFIGDISKINESDNINSEALDESLSFLLIKLIIFFLFLTIL